MNEEQVRQLAKNILSEQMSEEIKNHLDSAIIFKYINDLEQELQAYKDKEYRLREYISNIDNWNWKKLEGRTNQINKDDILDILNEGGKE